MAWKESFETVNRCKTRIMRGGKGAPLMFLHGARGASAWAPFMDKLSERFELIVPEHPGFGGSDTPPWLDNVGDLAYFYLDLIEQLGLEDVNLVGTSLGGWIAAELAVRDCHPLKSLALVAPAGIHVKGVAKGDIFMWSPEETLRKLFHDPKMVEAALAQPLPEGEVMIQAKNRLSMAKLSWQPRLYNPDLYKWLHRISVPTLILWGDDDKVIPPQYGPAFAELIPGAKLEVIEKCGHLPQIERADAFVSKIAGFITEVAR
jgi:pimeloyl-ACP methyl ester carboxylesterase